MTVYLINPNTKAATTDRMVAVARAAAPGLRIAGVTAPFGTAMITDPAALALSAEAVAAALADLPEPPEGVIIAAFGDPGLKAARASLPCPVLGIGETSFRAAATGGRRFGVATVTPDLVDDIAAKVAAAGLAGLFTGTCLTPGDPLALMAEPEAMFRALARAVEACADAGAERIIIGGGPLAEAAARLRAETGREIIEPVPEAARRMARLLA